MGITTEYKPKKDEVPPEFPDEVECDVVVIGGGPNGLIVSAYLSRAGLKVILCERRYEIGGGLATEEILFPGGHSNTHAVYHMMVDYMPPIKDFNLEKHLVYWIKPSVQVSMIFQDGTSISFGRMLQDSKDSISKISLKESDRFEKVIRKWRRFVDEILAPATYCPPLPPAEFFENLMKDEIGKEFAEIAEKSPLEIIDNEFSSDKVKALVTYLVGMWGVDPEEDGMGFMVPLLVVRGTQKYYCYGGSHRFASALGREICANGGIILDNAEVVRIIVEGKKAVGVELKDGRKIFAKVVVSSLPPQKTFFELIGEENLPESSKEEIRPLKEWKWDKWSFFTTHALVGSAPNIRCDDTWVNKSFMIVVGFDGLNDVVNFFRNLKEGKIKKVGGHITYESNFDDTLVRKSEKLGVAFFQMCAPYEENWEKKKNELEKEILKLWKDIDPEQNFKDTVSETPKDIEMRLHSMVKGSIKHGDYTPMQMGYFRPSESCSSSRTPIEGLYLCGASTYPGGLIIGGPGYISANIIAEDLGIKKWWKTPSFIEKYIKKYVRSEGD